jgi:hypothetical protein
MSDEPERVFSKLGLMITKRRNRLDEQSDSQGQLFVGN